MPGQSRDLTDFEVVSRDYLILSMDFVLQLDSYTKIVCLCKNYNCDINNKVYPSCIIIWHNNTCLHGIMLTSLA